eukprot:766448-Hanusia_phi.AAC.2
MQAVMMAAAVAMLWLQGSRGSGSCRSCFAPCSRLFRAQGNVLPSLRSCWCKSAKGPGWVTPARSLAQGSPGGETSNHVDPATNGGETTDKFLNKKIRVDELLVELGLASDMKVLPASLKLCRPPAVLLALIKPQFEALRHEVESGTGG